MRQSPADKALATTQKKEQEAQTPVFHRHTKPAALFLETSPFNEEGTAFDLLILYMKICYALLLKLTLCEGLLHVSTDSTQGVLWTVGGGGASRC